MSERVSEGLPLQQEGTSQATKERAGTLLSSARCQQAESSSERHTLSRVSNWKGTLQRKSRAYKM